jgi:DNA-binding MarR family transcriptional regulator
MDAVPRPPRYTDQLREIGTLARRFHALLAESLDLNPTALDAMDWLIRDGTLTPSEISARLGVSPGATTSIVRRLEETGHARRAVHDADRRSVRIVPAEASIATARDRLEPLVSSLRERVSRYSAEELELVSAFLDDVSSAYREGIAAMGGDADAPTVTGPRSVGQDASDGRVPNVHS